MTATEHLKITGPEDILGYIPHSLGYWPENSLVAMTMQGRQLGATLRVDLPPPGSPTGVAGKVAGENGTLAGFAARVVSYLEADDRADATLLAFFTPAGHDPQPERGTEGSQPRDGSQESAVPAAGAYADLLGMLEIALGAAGIPVKDAWLVGPEFWRNAYCTDPLCCTQPGRRVEEIRNSRLNAEMVLRGSSIGAAPDGQSADGDTTEPDSAALAAQQGWALQFSGGRTDRAQFRQVLAVWARVLHGLPGRECSAGLDLDLELAAYLRATLAIQAWRDAVLVMAAAGAAAAERGAEDFGLFCGVPGVPGATGRPVAPLPPLQAFPSLRASVTENDVTENDDTTPPWIPGYGEVLLGLAPPVPDWALMDRLDRVLKLLGGHGSGEARAACLTGRGWIEWCRGRGSFAHSLFRQAAYVCPGYRLAELLGELGRRGTLCGWAARRDAAWQKFPPDAA